MYVLTIQQKKNDIKLNKYSSDCENCFGLCCVALPFAKSADFPINKEGGTACKNLQKDFRCGIHNELRNKGFKGCTVYECFGAGQKVSNVTYKGSGWRDHPHLAKEMFDVFPIVQQIHEMLYYLNESLHREEALPIQHELRQVLEETESLTLLSAQNILNLDIPIHRAKVNGLLLQVSELVRAKSKKAKNQNKQDKIKNRSDLIGAKLRGANLKGTNFRGALLIASDLRESDLRGSDFIGADMRDADFSGANLLGSIFLTQAQVNSAKGDISTKLPSTLSIPLHWLD